jgi:hypothetical protein
VKGPQALPLDPRREKDLAAELLARARAWIPAWGLADGERDFGRALLEVAARFGSEVAERLDGAGDKMRRGFLDWLAVRGEAARPARVPVVFKLIDAARDAVLATAPVRMQAEAKSAGGTGTSVVFETETDVRLLPGRLQVVVGADAKGDAFYLPPPGLSDLEPMAPLPTRWRLKSFAAAGTTTLQVDPAVGLQEGTLVAIDGAQYRVAAPPNHDLVAVEPPVPAGGFADGTPVTKVTTFLAFDGARNQQNHVLYLGHPDLFDIEAQATIDVLGGELLGDGVVWEYWGRSKAASPPTGEADDAPAWHSLVPAAADRQKPGEALVLDKPPGAVEPRMVGKAQARWIRARTPHLDAVDPILPPEPIAVRINAPPPNAPVTPVDEPLPDAALLPPVDVLVNTTPETPRDFFPLGRAPRLFDTLYVGCDEAFSKHGAEAALHFDVAEPTFAAMAAIRVSAALAVVAGVDRAGALHLLEVGTDGKLSKLHGRSAMRPSGPGAAQGTRLTTRYYRPQMWVDANGDLLVAVAAGPQVWLWKENVANPFSSGWTSLGSPPVLTDPQAIVEGLALIDDGFGNTAVVALREKSLFLRHLDTAGWSPLSVEKSGNVVIDVAAIATVRAESSGQAAKTLLLVDSQNRLFAFAPGLLADQLSSVNTLVAPDVAPFGVVRASGVEVVAVAANHDELLAWQGPTFSSITSLAASQMLDSTDEIKGAQVDSAAPNWQPLLDAHVELGQLTVYALASSTEDGPVVLGWKPFAPSLAPLVFKTRNDPSKGLPRWGLTLLETRAYMPGAFAGEVVAVVLDGDRTPRQVGNNDLLSALGVQNPPEPIAVGDYVAYVDSSPNRGWAGVSYPAVNGRDAHSNESFLWLDSYLERGNTAPGTVHWYGNAFSYVGTRLSNLGRLELDGADVSSTQANLVLLIEDTTGFSVRQVTAFIPPANAGDPRIAMLDDPLPSSTPATPKYWIPKKEIQARIVPSMDVTNVANANNWAVDVLDRGDVYFPDPPGPQRQRVIAVTESTVAPHPPLRLAFEDAWVAAPPSSGMVDFIVDAQATAWAKALGDDTANPALAWEYWNGNGWERLTIDGDTTHHFKNSGVVAFVVPADLEPTDWAGKTSRFVRARLIGGDYGREQVVATSSTTGGVTTQTIDRSTDGIQAPYVLDLWVRYAINSPALPQLVLTADSGTLRDQSDANRTHARVEVFTPLAATLGGLETAAAAASQVQGRALFLGFRAPLSGTPVNVLLLVAAEREHELLAPMKIEALAADGFVPVVTEDSTRALGESGLLSMSFPVAPTPRQLFGYDDVTWLRLTPAPGSAADEWRPTLRGAYLNAVWASAQETLTRELLGSSQGEPNLTVRLARPPVLHGTLELRVREPLGEEARTQLRAGDATRVLTGVEGLPGDWVRWEPALDPGDEKPEARVYALDETTGEIRFGDGRHGMIPPIGRDAIVAFTYKRTESAGEDVPANTIGARAALDLVSPVESVEAVFAADQAAGGAPPETDERVLRFGTARLRHRNRAVTVADFEDLALQSSPDVVQARCFVGDSGVKVVVVMRGRDPLPSAAEARAVRAQLLAAAPAALAAPRALRVTGPRVRRLRVVLRLRVVSLDHAGAVSREVEKKIAALFDSSTGGRDGSGWALGRAPSDEEVARVLIDVRRLAGLAVVTLEEVLPDGTEQAWADAVLTRPVRRDDLVMLDEDAVRLGYEVVEVVA